MLNPTAPKLLYNNINDIIGVVIPLNKSNDFIKINFSLDIANVANTVLGIIIAIFIAIINNNTFIKLYSLTVNLLPNIASILYIATNIITNTKIPNIVNNDKNNPFNL